MASISIPKGDSDTYTIVVQDITTGTAVTQNIAGYTIATIVKRNFTDPDNMAVIPLKEYVLPTNGTGTITSSGTSVLGTSTLFLTQLNVGDTITASGQTKTIATITDNTHLTTTAAFTPVVTAASFTLGTLKYIITWTAAETEAVPFGNYVYDIRIKDASGTPTTLMADEFIITNNATRSF